MAVEWVSDPVAFVALDWTGLVDADPDGTFFHTPRYLKLYWEEFGTDGVEVALVHEGDRAVTVAPFHIIGGKATFLGGFDVTDYLGPVGAPEARERAAKELMGSLASRDEWAIADLRGLPAEGGWLPALQAGAGDAGLEVAAEDDGVAPFLELPGSFEDYLASLPGKLRHEIRRKLRRFWERAPRARLVDATPATVAADLGRFVELHRRSRGRKGRFMAPGIELFFRRLADDLLEDGTLRLAFLEADGQKIAGAVGFRDRDRFLLYNSAYDHARAALGPGIVLVAELLRSAVEEGCQGFDFLKGDLPYKYRFGARPRPMMRLVLRRP